ncbi:MAG: hypothetical protein MHPSP_001441, partial [Paramarteilia canceri]
MQVMKIQPHGILQIQVLVKLLDIFFIVASSLKRSTLKKFTSLRKSKKEINKAPVKQVESSDKPINVEDISKNDNGRDVNESKIIENQDNKFDQIQENRLDILNEEKDSKLLPNLILKTDQMSPKFSDDQKQIQTDVALGGDTKTDNQIRTEHLDEIVKNNDLQQIKNNEEQKIEEKPKESEIKPSSEESIEMQDSIVKQNKNELVSRNGLNEDQKMNNTRNKSQEINAFDEAKSLNISTTSSKGELKMQLNETNQSKATKDKDKIFEKGIKVS